MIWTLIGFCVLAGLAQAFDWLLAEAASAALEEGAPLIHSLLKLLPDEVPEKEEIRRMTRVANSVGVVSDHDSQWVRSILEVGSASDGSWSNINLPFLMEKNLSLKEGKLLRIMNVNLIKGTYLKI